MPIVYCIACAERIESADLERGDAIRVGECRYCKRCAPRPETATATIPFEEDRHLRRGRPRRSESEHRVSRGRLQRSEIGEAKRRFCMALAGIALSLLVLLIFVAVLRSDPRQSRAADLAVEIGATAPTLPGLGDGPPPAFDVETPRGTESTDLAGESDPLADTPARMGESAPRPEVVGSPPADRAEAEPAPRSEPWKTVFDGADLSSLCLKHDEGTWEVRCGTLHGRNESARSWIHVLGKARHFRLSLEYRVARGELHLQKPHSFDLALATDAGAPAWHRLLLAHEGSGARSWIDGRPAHAADAVAEQEAVLGFMVVPGGEVELRNIRIQVLP